MNYKLVLDLAKELDIDEVELISNKTTSKEISLFGKEVDKNIASKVESVSIRGAYKGKLAKVSTENISKEGLRQALELLKDNSQVITSDEPYVIYEGSKKYPKITRKMNDFSVIPTSKKIQDLRDLHDEILKLNPNISKLEFDYGEEKTETILINSKGLNLKKGYSFAYMVASAVLTKDSDTRDEYSLQIKLDYNDFNVKELAKVIVTRLERKMNPVQIPSNAYPVILENKMVVSLLGAFTSMFSSESALRNMTLLKGKEGEKIASDLVTIVDDPLYEKGIFQHSFDDQGVACYKKNIIDKGVFKTLLYDLKTAKMLNTEPTGNYFGGIRPTNMRLECGTSSMEDLSKDIEDGVLITSLQGLHSGLNPVSGDFSCQASGFKIEKGQITYPISLIVVSGNFLKLLQDVEAIGNDEYISSSGVSAPSIRIKSLPISGK